MWREYFLDHFESQTMKHPSTQEIFTYWNTLREARPAPLRSQINPVAIPKVLPDIFLLDCIEDDQHLIRLAGTRLCTLFGKELRGQSFNSLWNEFGEHHIDDLLRTVVDEHAAVVAGAEGYSSSEHLCRLELILLPLRTNDGSPTRVIGCLSPSTLPLWFSVQHVASVHLTTVRYYWPTGRRDAGNTHFESGEADSLVQARRIGRFMVYEGGAAKTAELV